MQTALHALILTALLVAAPSSRRAEPVGAASHAVQGEARPDGEGGSMGLLLLGLLAAAGHVLARRRD